MTHGEKENRYVGACDWKNRAKDKYLTKRLRKLALLLDCMNVLMEIPSI
jgi:hypothetical protein